MNLAKLREDVAMKEGDLVSMFFKDKSYTNLEMLQSARKLAAALKKLGVRKGDRVIVQMPNCVEVLLSFGAIWRLGAIIVPINYMMGDEEVSYIYRDSGAKIVVSSMQYLPKIRIGQTQAPDVRTVILIEDDVPADCLSYQKLVEQNPEEHEIVDMGNDDIATIIYTAGTTGKSKGVMLSHYALYYNAKMMAETVVVPDGTAHISALPLCHSYGISLMNSGLFRKGTRTVLLDTFDLDMIYDSIEKYQINLMGGVPTMFVYMLLYPNPQKRDLSSMKFWMSGSAPLSVETWTKFRDVFGGEIAEGWGLTEAGANNCANPIYGLKKIGSIGLPMNGTDMKIMDEKGNILNAGEHGEIVIRGPQLMAGYWNKPAETAEAIRDGWLHTGDMGHFDEDGYFWITDRKKDIIIKGGENISPRKVEEVLYAHPRVSEAAVVGVPDEKYGEAIKAFIVLNPGQTATTDEIRDYCREKLSSFLAPRDVAFLAAFPKNLVGKILKKELRKL